MAERFNAAVLKTVVVKATWGSNPYSSASGSRILTVMLECDFSISALQVLQGLLHPTQKIEYTQTHYLTPEKK